MTAERQRGALDPPRQPSGTQVPVEPPQPGQIDRAVVHPHALQQAGGSRRPLTEKQGLVGQIQHVVHDYAASVSSVVGAKVPGSCESGWRTTTTGSSAAGLATRVNTRISVAM